MKYATKKKSKKKAPKKESTGKRGRTSAYAGLKIYKLKTDEESGIRSAGKVREAWDLITKGMLVETFRDKATCGHGLARKFLADFIAKGLVEVK